MQNGIGYTQELISDLQSTYENPLKFNHSIHEAVAQVADDSRGYLPSVSL